MSRDAARALGGLLAGAWRATPGAALPALAPARLEELAPLLHRSGTSPLAWRRVAGGPLAELPVGQLLRRDYLAQAGAAALHERAIVQVVGALRAAGVEPLLSKGWAVARHYAEPGLRPAADVDLFVAPGELAAAEAVLAAPELGDARVDLHAGLPDLPDRAFGEIVARAELVPLAGVPVRVPAPDDLLRHVCLHLLRHAAWRPLWFCDVGALVEAEGARLDWDRLRHGSALHSGWVAQVIGLAGTLVGADLSRVPWEPARVPPWLEAAVLDHWMRGDAHLYDGVPLAHHLRHPGRFWSALARRWPSPLQASVDRGAPFDDAWRFPLQLADWLLRAARSLWRLPRTLLYIEG